LFVYSVFFFSSRRRHTRSKRDWSSDVCSSDLDVHEDVPISIEDDTGFGMSVLYFSDDNKKLLEDNLEAFKTRLGYEGEFEKLEKSNRTIYYANQEDDVFRTYAAYILNGKNSGAIEVIYNIDCQDEKEEICEKNKESDKERA